MNTAHLHPVKVLGASGIHLALGASFSYRLYHPRLVNRLGDRFQSPDIQSLSEETDDYYSNTCTESGSPDDSNVMCRGEP